MSMLREMYYKSLDSGCSRRKVIPALCARYEYIMTGIDCTRARRIHLLEQTTRSSVPLDEKIVLVGRGNEISGQQKILHQTGMGLVS